MSSLVVQKYSKFLSKARNEIFCKQSEDILTTRDVGLDKEEETEEALIITSLGVHSESMQPSECTDV